MGSEKHKYLIEVYTYGYKSETYETEDYELARRRLMIYLKCDLGVKLYIDSEEVKFLEIKKVMNINTYKNM